jgi:hypothetical protein
LSSTGCAASWTPPAYDVLNADELDELIAGLQPMAADD